MKLLSNKLKVSAITALFVSTAAFADNTSDIAELKRQIAELTKQTNIQQEQTQSLIDETSDLKSGFNYTTVETEKSFAGLGAAASKVYYSKSPLSIGGYGEMYYSHASKEAAADVSTVDVYRFVPYIGYKFTDNIILNVELEFEHGGADSDNTDGGYVIVEFMYLDFLLDKKYNFRIGHMLMPMGLINERHEPTLFTTVQRPNTSKYLIPSTWHESGVMVFGELAQDLNYKIAGVTGLDDSQTGSSWIRNARGGSFKQDNSGTNQLGLGLTARLDYTGVNGLLIGASTYIDSSINMWDVHADYKAGAFRAYGVYTQTNRDDEAAARAGNGETEANGGFINIGYDLLSLVAGYDKKLPLFVQYESVSSQDKLLDGTSVDSINTTTVGINFFPHEQVVLKLDYAMQEQNSLDVDTFSASIGFIF